MRLITTSDGDNPDFADMLIAIGQGTFSPSPHIGQYKMKVPDNLILNSSHLSHLCDFAFSDLEAKYQNKQ